MRISPHLLIWTSCILLLPFSCGADTSTTNPNNFLVYQIVQTQFVFDASTVKSASLIQHDDGGYGGLLIELKGAAADQIEKLTTDAMHKTANLIFNNKVISSSTIESVLGNKLVINGITNEDALKFISSLKDSTKPKIEFS